MNQRRILGLPVCFGCLSGLQDGRWIFRLSGAVLIFSPFIWKGYFKVKFFLAKNMSFHNQHKMLAEPNFPNRMNENCGWVPQSGQEVCKDEPSQFIFFLLFPNTIQQLKTRERKKFGLKARVVHSLRLFFLMAFKPISSGSKALHLQIYNPYHTAL